MRRVIWSDRSAADVEQIVAYVAEFSPTAAQRLYDRFLRVAQSLKDNPDRGRVKGRARELVVLSPYIIRYRVGLNDVTILRVRHGARRPS